jgi:hypothetical protein
LILVSGTALVPHSHYPFSTLVPTQDQKKFFNFFEDLSSFGRISNNNLRRRSSVAGAA